jgi:cytochrome c oxidase subunit 1
MPRRYADYLDIDNFAVLNSISTIGAFIIGASTLPFLYNVWKSYKAGRVVEVNDPWGYGMSLEWATSCPPPLRNFDSMPRIRSERPAFDAKFPAYAPGHSLVAAPAGGAKPLTSESDGGASYEEDTGANRD